MVSVHTVEFFDSCSCVMVLGIGEAPSAFTLDHNIGEFVLTNASLSIPPAGKIYSINEGNAALWDEPTSKCAPSPVLYL